MYELHVTERATNLKPQGMALVSALVMVLILGVLSIAIAQQSTSSRRNTAVHQDHAISYFNTASGINEAEAVFRDNAYLTDLLKPDAENSIVLPSFASNDWWKAEANWSAATKVRASDGQPIDGSPEYLIEDLGVDSGLMLGVTVPKRRFYRVTARASGQATALSFHQTHIALVE